MPPSSSDEMFPDVQMKGDPELVWTSNPHKLTSDRDRNLTRFHRSMLRAENSHNIDPIYRNLSLSQKEELAYSTIMSLDLPANSIHRICQRISQHIFTDFVAVIPYEIILEIFSLLDGQDLLITSLVSRRWHKISQDPLIWYHAFLKEEWSLTPQCLSTPRNTIDWKTAYRIRSHLDASWRSGLFQTTMLSAKWYSRSHHEAIYTIQFDASRSIVISGSRDRTIKAWNIVTGQCLKTLVHHKGSVLCLALDLDNNRIVSGSSDNTIAVWNYESGQVVAELTDHQGSVLNVRLYQGYIVSCSKDSTIRVWDSRTYSCIRVLTGHLGAVNSIQIANDIIASASGDKQVKLWDLNSGICLRTLTGHTRGVACLSFDGTNVISGSSDHSIRVHEAATGRLLGYIPNAHRDIVRTLYQQGNFMITGSYDETIKVWGRKESSASFWIPLYTLRLSEWAPGSNKLFSIACNARYLIVCSQVSSMTCFDFGDEIPRNEPICRYFA